MSPVKRALLKIIRKDQSLISAAMLKARIAGALGGRAAEQLVFGTNQVHQHQSHFASFTSLCIVQRVSKGMKGQ